MNDNDWGDIAKRLGFAWPATPLSPQSLEAYRAALDDLDPIAVVAAVDGFIRENRETIPPPAAIRARVRNGAGSTPLPPPAAVAAAPAAAPTPTPPPPAPTAPPPASPPPAPASGITVVPAAQANAAGGITIRKTPPVLVAVAAALVTFISCFMPWISTPFGSVAGTSTDDGKIVLVVSAIGVGLILFSNARVAFAVISALFAIGCIITFIVDMNEIQSRVSDTGLGGIASVGGGIYLGLIASIVWVLAAVISGIDRRETASAPSAP